LGDWRPPSTDLQLPTTPDAAELRTALCRGQFRRKEAAGGSAGVRVLDLATGAGDVGGVGHLAQVVLPAEDRGVVVAAPAQAAASYSGGIYNAYQHRDGTTTVRGWVYDRNSRSKAVWMCVWSVSACQRWVRADQLILGEDRVVVGLEGPVDEPDADEANYALVVGNLKLTMDTPQERLRTLAVRIGQSSRASVLGRLRRQSQHFPPSIYLNVGYGVRQTHLLAAPRVAIMHTWQATQNDGWYRIALDYLSVPYTYIPDTVVREMKPGELRQKFDVIIMPPYGRDLSGVINGIGHYWAIATIRSRTPAPISSLGAS